MKYLDWKRTISEKRNVLVLGNISLSFPSSELELKHRVGKDKKENMPLPPYKYF
jgi:hypothetical protein